MTALDGPLEAVAAEAANHVREGKLVFQKWTCSHCGERIMMETPNQFFTQGRHDDCPNGAGNLTDIRERGCNYLVMSAGSPKGEDILRSIMDGLL